MEAIRTAVKEGSLKAKEMQSLALDVRIEGQTGADTAAREDDELLRAAEELGIDLSGATAAMITLERAGGAQGEPGPQVAFGELQS